MRHYLVGKDRCLVHTDSPLLEGWEKCTELKQLMAFSKDLPDAFQEGLKWKGSKMPSSLFKQVLGTIQHYPNMETAYSLYYRLSDNSWAINCPEQKGCGVHVDFEDPGNAIAGGYGLIGSIHTHPNMTAFWSSTDLNDQKNKHGVHIVLGLKGGKPAHTLCTIFTPNGNYDVPLWDVVEETDLTADYDPVQAWIDIIDKQSYKETPKVTYVSTSASYKTHGGYWDDLEAYYPAKKEEYYGKKDFTTLRELERDDKREQKHLSTDASILIDSLADDIVGSFIAAGPEAISSLLEALANNGIDCTDYGEARTREEEVSIALDKLEESLDTLLTGPLTVEQEKEVAAVLSQYGIKAAEDIDV